MYYKGYNVYPVNNYFTIIIVCELVNWYFYNTMCNLIFNNNYEGVHLLRLTSGPDMSHV